MIIKYLKVTFNSEEGGAGGSMTESAMQNSIRLLRELDLITCSIQHAFPSFLPPPPLLL